MKTNEKSPGRHQKPGPVDDLPAPRRGPAPQVSTKVQPHHLERLAIVYVRQSSLRQLVTNRESTDLQYNLVHRAHDLGWRPDRTVVIDEDQGLSGRTAEGRLGFQRLLAEVGLAHVGLVLGIEMSRLARSCKDWHQLLELCSIFRTLLADQDGIYDPTDYNDRLLLGLKGTMSEAELHIMRGRLLQGKRNKARRGELYNRLPVGYLLLPSGELAMDPDEQVQAVVRLCFEMFEEIGTGRGVCRYLVRQGIRFPFRDYTGPDRGVLRWRPPATCTVYDVLRHPFYAGAYVHGRRRTDPRRKVPGHPATGRITVPSEEWEVLIRDHHPAYITWERYLANRRRLVQNASRPDTLGTPRDGPTLLGGLAICGRCDWRMKVLYHVGTHHLPSYHCPSKNQPSPEPMCQTIAARVVDDLVSRQVLRALEPAALELSIQAQQDIERERRRLQEDWKQRLERARYQSERARRQYDEVEPENRLVVRELERRWEQCLIEERMLREEYERSRIEQPFVLSSEDRDRIAALSADIPTLWNASTTTPSDRQVIIRHLVERVVISIHGTTEVVDVAIHWAGGFISRHEILRPVGRYGLMKDYDRLISRIEQLKASHHTAGEIAEQLNAEGFHPARLDGKFRAIVVRMLMARAGLGGRRVDSTSYAHLLGPDEWWASDLTRELSVPRSVLCKWCCQGWVHARKVFITRRRWIIWADAEERDRLRRLHADRRQCATHRYPTELTTPKRKP